MATIDELIANKFWTRTYPQEIRAEIEIPKKSFHQLFLEAAKKKPNDVVVIFAGEQFTYRKLLDASMRVAGYLKSLGLDSGDRVALVLPNSPQFITSYYGTLMAGGTVVPINPLYKSTELHYILNKSKARFVFSLDLFHDEVFRALSGTKVERLIVTNIADVLSPIKSGLGRLLKKVPSKPLVKDPRISKYSEAASHRPISPSAISQVEPLRTPAAICFTSGTTGLPKGAVLTHHNLVTNVHQSYEVARAVLTEDETVLAVLPFFHIYGQTAIMGIGLTFGFKLVVVPRPNIDEILELIERYRISIIFGVPSLYNALITSPKFRRETFSHVKLCISGADKLHEEIAKRFEKATGIRIVEGYGLTETSPVTHLNPPTNPRLGSIGPPVPNTYAWVFRLDANAPLGIGEVGELAISGPQVMDGYLEDPEANKAAFFTLLGRRWFRTGDIAKVDEDGFFYIIERKKDLIKYKGWSIYPAEVENVVLKHEAVKSAAVVGVPDVEVGERVVMIVALKDEYKGKLTEESLKAWCERNLAPFQVPEKIIFKDELPISMTGKVLRRVLKEEVISTLKR
ncbi:MAG: long-chain fatty acid--CoA ligase [Thaumarchaeota archaeon]|nr:long-chain fatty acid--CoA ligase [Candidatus Calditenuaceae archaeon]MDW8187123.1 long-chain fatty acid--CoA ligase [Nitrososphaerota archaeon]